MLQQTAIPRTPEEVAACLNLLTREDQNFIKGAIVGLIDARQRPITPQQQTHT